jgi:hypothetical protein
VVTIPAVVGFCTATVEVTAGIGVVVCKNNYENII